MSRLIVFEGPDGVGKSTLALWFADQLRETGTDSVLLSFPGREPGTLGHHVYELHHNPPRFGIEDLASASLQLLHVAAHIDAIERRIKPLLASGKTVVLDRFWWSTYVYGLIGGVSRDVLERMIELERRVWEPLRPDRLLHISRESPLRNEPPDLWPLWRTAYEELAHRESEFYPVVTIVNDKSIQTAQERILTTV